MPTPQKSALWILAALAVLLVIGAGAKYFKPDIDLVAYVSGISTLAVALLTVAYVVTTSNQLSVMNRQLDEMRKAREYQAQPLPVLREVQVVIERPRLFYTPPEAAYSAHSRAHAKYKVRNEGSHPAINTVLSAWIGLPSVPAMTPFDCSSRLVEIIAEGGIYPPTDGEFDDFMFAEDENAQLIAAIRDKNLSKPPLLKVRSVFRNALGACYATSSMFMLYMKQAADEPILTDWHSAIVAFSVKFKSELEQLQKLQNKNEQEWERLFSALKEQFASLVPGPEELALSCIPVPMTYSVELLSEDQYKKETDTVGFGPPIPLWYEGCVHHE